MIITFILTFIGVFGTLTIVAYLRQVEDVIAELQHETAPTICPVCHIPHQDHAHKIKKKYGGLRRIKGYYKCKRRAAYRFYKSGKEVQK